MAGPGWQDFWGTKGEPFDSYVSAEGFRQRHLIDGFQAVIKTLSSMQRM